jgi:hypothetical protein
VRETIERVIPSLGNNPVALYGGGIKRQQQQNNNVVVESPYKRGCIGDKLPQPMQSNVLMTSFQAAAAIVEQPSAMLSKSQKGFIMISFWRAKCEKDHAGIFTGENRQNRSAAKADLKQHRKTDHAGKHVGEIEELHL